MKTITRLIDFYNEGICPVVYEFGSLGAAGDLAALRHLSLPLIGLGEVSDNNKILHGKALNKKMELLRVELKDGYGIAYIK